MHEAGFYRQLWSALLGGQEFLPFANRRKSGEPYYADKIIGFFLDRLAQALRKHADAAMYAAKAAGGNRYVLYRR